MGGDDQVCNFTLEKYRSSGIVGAVFSSPGLVISIGLAGIIGTNGAPTTFDRST